MDNRSTPETPELKTSSATVEDLTSYAGLTLDDLVSANTQAIMAAMDRGEYESRVYPDIFGLSEGEHSAAAVRGAVEGIAREYEQKFAERLDDIRQVADHCVQLAGERGYVQGRQARVVMVDMRLLEGARARGLRAEQNQYSPEADVAFVDIESSLTVLRHELGHLLSARPEAMAGGFLTYQRQANGSLDAPQFWLDEGATVVWEDVSLVGKNDEPNRSDSQDFYTWSGQAARLVAAEAGVDEDGLLRAYFGDPAARQKLEQGIQRRFGLDLATLDCLSAVTNLDFTSQVISGQPAEVQYRVGVDHESVLVSYRELSKNFPNVHIREIKST